MLTKHNKFHFSILSAIIFFVLCIYVVGVLLPLVWGMVTSLRDAWDFEDSAISLPKEFKWENYKTAIKAFTTKIDTEEGYKEISFFSMIVNTLLYAGGCAIMVTIVPCLTAYIVSKFKFRILKIYTSIVIICMALPIVGNMPSMLQMMSNLKIYDTIWGMWLIKGYFIGMFYLVFLASFKAIPDSFTEAAQIDGASNFTVMIRVILPLVRTTLTTVMLIQFIDLWNDYLTPRLYMPSVPTLAVGLFKFAFNPESKYGNPPTQLAGCMLLLIPILLIYIVLHKRLIGNVTMGGLKE